MINILNNLLKDIILLKPDNDNDIVLDGCLGYKKLVKLMFSGRSRFRQINKDPAFRRLSCL